MKKSARRPDLRTRSVWLAILGVLFYSSYSLSNWLAAARGSVPSVVFDWERHIPFMEWTIIPYWTTNFFYAASLFIIPTRPMLGAHIKRLVTAQVVAVACFLLWPLQFTFARPDVTGAISGFLFDVLGGFDKPFNQAPSLHIALTVILADVYFRLLPHKWKYAFAAWSALVMASVLTTYQHHFIDIPTGLLLGLGCLWLWPLDGDNRLRDAAWSLRGRRGVLAAAYGALAALLAAGAACMGGTALWLLWPAVSFGMVAAGYAVLGAEVFAKNGRGVMPWHTQVLLWPYVLLARINAYLWTRGDTTPVEIAPKVFVGPVCAAGKEYGIVIDMTAEMPRRVRHNGWRSFPVLDLTPPPADVLENAAETVQRAIDHGQQGRVLIACALGYGRSITVAAVWLVRAGYCKTAAEAVDLLKQKRPRLRLSAAQMAAIERAAQGR